MTDIDIDDEHSAARVANADGDTDVAFSARTPHNMKHVSGEQVSSLTSYTTIEGAWHSTLSQTNVLSAGTATLPRGVDLQLGVGRVADDIRSLRPIRTIRLDVMTEGQNALHMPVPTSVRTRG